jgi:hypothetical protein
MRVSVPRREGKGNKRSVWMRGRRGVEDAGMCVSSAMEERDDDDDERECFDGGFSELEGGRPSLTAIVDSEEDIVMAMAFSEF